MKRYGIASGARHLRVGVETELELQPNITGIRGSDGERERPATASFFGLAGVPLDDGARFCGAAARGIEGRRQSVCAEPSESERSLSSAQGSL